MTIWKITIHLVFERSIDEDVKDFKSKADYNKFLNEEYAKEPNPTQKQLDAYMRNPKPWGGSKASRFLDYLEELHLFELFGTQPSNIKYSNGGKLSFELSDVTPRSSPRTEEKARRKAQRKARRERSWLSWFSSKEEEVKTPPPPPTAESIVKHIEFEEDGFTDGMYEGNPGNQGVYPSKYDEDEELGVIRIDLATISVVKKKFSSTKTKPKTDRRRPIRQKSAKKKQLVTTAAEAITLARPRPRRAVWKKSESE